MAVTVTQLAREAKVSVSLVSRYVNRHPSLQISDAKRQQIEAAAQRLGGMPHGRGGAASSAVTMSRHVVFPMVAQPGGLIDAARRTVSAHIYVHARRALEEAAFRFSTSLYEVDTLAPGVRDLITQSPRLADGLLLGTSFLDDQLTELILHHAIPHVSIESQAAEVHLNTVLVDEKLALAEAVALLQSLGHTRIGYFGTRGYFRFAPIAGAIIDAGLPFGVDQGCIFNKPHETGPPLSTLGLTADAAFRAWLPARGDITALICSSDHLATIAVKAMRDLGLTPGRELSLVGYGNAASHITAPDQDTLNLTTIDQHPDRVGHACADVLIQQIRHKRSGPIHEYIPASLVIRQTTGQALR